MSEVVFSRDFVNHFKKLPLHIRSKTDSLIDILSVDYRDSRLRTKKLHGENNLYSFRISHDYRVIFQFIDSQKIYLLDVKHRKDIYRNL